MKIDFLRLLRHVVLLGWIWFVVNSIVASRGIAVAAAGERDTTASMSLYQDNSGGDDWPGYGRTFGQQHYSPLRQIDSKNVKRLGLAWFLDLGPENSATQPIAVDGILYFATGLSVVQAVDASTGQLLWKHDPRAAEKAYLNLRHGWGVRGIAWWDGKIYTGTVDGRLIALDGKTGTQLWSVRTFEPGFAGHINGAPRVFNGKVIIGYAGSTGAGRGFVTTYDAATGRKLWKFFTVPGSPKNGFESKAMEMAAGTWRGEWWTHGGGGANVWNGITYDPETDTVFIGTGSAYVHNRRIRSADQGDNLFASSIVALNGSTGAYKWHYQTTPGDTWDYDAVMDMELADLTINGVNRKLLMQAPKNGFFYVIDRINGHLISATPYSRTTWAKGVDPNTGRPIETADARYPNKSDPEIWPSGIGAHSWMPMSYDIKSRLVYIPEIDNGIRYTDKGIDLLNWKAPVDRADDFGVGAESAAGSPGPTGQLIAWDPIAAKTVWSVKYPTMYNGGILSTAGQLVFQGSIDHVLKAYDARSGRLAWAFDAKSPIIATPISYSVLGKQYITILTGLGMGIVQGAGFNGLSELYQLDARSQKRRVLTFRIGGNVKLPEAQYFPLPPVEDTDFRADSASSIRGATLFGRDCARCHGPAAIAVIQAPDLRRSPIILSSQAFESIVRCGNRVRNGMPEFAELRGSELEDLRQYIRSAAAELRSSAVRKDRSAKTGMN